MDPGVSSHLRTASLDEARRLPELERVLKSGWLIKKGHATSVCIH